jgi:hypothetical protein
VVAQRENISELDALRSVYDVEAFRADIDTEKARLQAKADAEAEALWRLTPNGKTQTAREHRQTIEAKRNRANEGRDLLAAAGFADVDDLSDDEAIDLSGIDRDDSKAIREALDPATNAQRIAEIEARQGGDSDGS